MAHSSGGRLAGRPVGGWTSHRKNAPFLYFHTTRDTTQHVEAERVYNFDAVFILFVLLALATCCLSVFIFVPLWLAGAARNEQNPQQRLQGGSLAYFVLIGLGFILVEVVLIQRFDLYLGHAIYSLAVI